MIKLALFDLDGTLFDTKDVNYYAYKEAVEQYGYSIDYEYYCNFCNGRHYLEFLPQITTIDETILYDMHENKKNVYSKYIYKAIPNRHLIKLLRLMRSEYKTALVTTASRKNAIEILQAFSVSDLFDLILTNEDVGKMKPDPEGFIKAMDYFEVNAKETMIFEDSVIGVKAAECTGASIFVVKGFN